MSKSSNWTDFEERGHFRLFKFIIFLNRIYVLNWWTARVILYVIMTFYFLVEPEKRSQSRDYLNHLYRTESGQQVLGDRPTIKHVYRHFMEFGRGIFNRFALWLRYKDIYEIKEIPSEGRELFYSCVESNQGAILLSFHVGHFDIMRFEAMDKGITINVVWYGENTPLVNNLLKEIDVDSHLNVVDIDPKNPQSMLELKDYVDRGEFVAILGDRKSVGATGRTTEVDFLGERAWLPQGPYILGGLLECPVIVSYTIRSGFRQYEIHSEKFADDIDLPRDNRPEAIRNYAQQYANAMERACCRAPYQWFNFFDFWVR